MFTVKELLYEFNKFNIKNINTNHTKHTKYWINTKIIVLRQKSCSLRMMYLYAGCFIRNQVYIIKVRALLHERLDKFLLIK